MADALDLLCRNAVDVISKEELGRLLEQSKKDGRPLRVKAGFDPSAPDIHLGHTVLLRKLRQFQDLGHKVVLIIGDFTAMIGDPTGQNKTRPALSSEEVAKNAKTYKEQAFKILDSSAAKIEVVSNSAWFGQITLQAFLSNIAGQFNVARMLERDDFEKRMAENKPISLREFLYPALQAYDSIMVESDIELGGTDQLFNLLAGRTLQEKQHAMDLYRKQPQVVMTLPLLVGLDGAQKMSKSLGNYIAVNDTPKDVFGKAMSIPDALMPSYFDLLTDESGEGIRRAVEGGKLHPRDAKVKLGKALTAALYGAQAADAQAAEFDRVFREKQAPDAPEEVAIPAGEIWIVDLLRQCGAAASGSDARRLIEQGGVTLDGTRLADSSAKIKPKSGSLLKVGKKKFVKLVVQKS